MWHNSFIKNQTKQGYVSFHQDAKYIGLEPHNWVTAWIAVTDANEENGCMRMWAGSHNRKSKHHNQKFDENNLLTRGQTIENVPIMKRICCFKGWTNVTTSSKSCSWLMA